MAGVMVQMLLMLLISAGGVGGEGEECAVERLEQDSQLYNCLSRVSYSARQMAPSEAIPGSGDLRVFMDAHFRGREDTFQACCQTQRVGRSNIRLNPVDGAANRLESHLVRNEPVFNFYLRENSGLPTGSGNYFFLILFNFFSTDRHMGTVQKPFCNLAMANINGLDAPVGDILVSYLSPTRENTPYTYILYRQPGRIVFDLDALTGSHGVCTGLNEHRCLWDLNALINHNNLEAVGSTWHYVTSTTWSNYHSIHIMEEPEATVCEGVGGSVIRAGGAGRSSWVECIEERCNADYLINSALNLTLCLDDIKFSMLGSWSTIFASASLSVFLDLTFRSPEWAASACCQEVSFDAALMKINPSRMDDIPGHVVVNQPQVEFITTSTDLQHGDTEHSMLILVDLTSERTSSTGVIKHQVYWLLTNIEGLELSTADEIIPYYRPLMDDHEYVLLLFKQPMEILVDVNQYGSEDCFRGTSLCAMEVNKMTLNIGLQLVGASKFILSASVFQDWYEIHSLGVPATVVCARNPKAVIRDNSVICPQDQCSLTQLSDVSSFEGCMDIVHKAAIAVSPELVYYSDNFDVYIDVKFRRTKRELEVCCEWVSMPEVEFHLNPLSGVKPDVFQLTGEKIDFSFYTHPSHSLLTPQSTTFFLLLMLDVSGGAPFFRSDLPFLHMAISDIPDLQIERGTTVYDLFKPAVPNDHLILLYRQPYQLSPGVDFTSYSLSTDVCPPFAVGRCLFDVRHLVREHGLILEGTIWVTPRVSKYGWLYNYLYNREENPKTTCSTFAPGVGVEGDEIVCPAQVKCSPENLPKSLAFSPCLKLLKEQAYQATSLVQSTDELLVYLSIKYTWSSMVVKACCKESSWVAGSLQLDPLADQHIQSYQLQQEPEVTILLAPTSTEGSTGERYLFCLVSYSSRPSVLEDSSYIGPGRYFIHWAIANIQGVNLRSGDTLYSYISPSGDGVYAFLMFRQHDVIDLEDITTYSEVNDLQADCYPGAPGRCQFNLDLFRTDHQLHLVGIAVVKPEDDPVYSASILFGLGVSDTDICLSVNPQVSLSATGSLRCPSARCDVAVMAEVPSNIPLCLENLKKAASFLVTLPKGLPQDPSYSVFMYLSFETQEEQFSACSRQECVPKSSFRLNALDESRPHNYKLRNKPDITFFISPTSRLVFGDLSQLYTLVLLDLGGPSILPEEEMLYPYAYWMQGNIQGLDLTSGDEILPYWGPDEVHHYVLYLFKQKEFHGFDLDIYTLQDSRCSGASANRCGFKLGDLLLDLDLELVGVSWVQPSWSPFTSRKRAALGLPCPSVADWAPNCQSPEPGGGEVNSPSGSPSSSQAPPLSFHLPTCLTMLTVSFLCLYQFWEH